MVDWAGHGGQSTASRYRAMAERQLRGVSPTYERLCLGVADDPDLIALLDTLPAPKRQPNLLLAGVRFLNDSGRAIDSYSAFRAWVIGNWDELAATMRERRTQTNEAGRCAVLLPVLAGLPGPLALLEVGASAGLCLYPDRYRYRYVGLDGEHVVGPVQSPVELECAIEGPVPLPDSLPTVVWRRGLDLNPLDVENDDDVRWLECLIWPEHVRRFEVLRGAVGVAREAWAEARAQGQRAIVRRGDLLTDLAAMAGDAPADATVVVFHSAVLAYLRVDQRLQFRAEVARLAEQRPTVWLSNEGPGVVVDTPAPAGSIPFVLARDGQELATASPHGQWLHWLAP